MIFAGRCRHPDTGRAQRPRSGRCLLRPCTRPICVGKMTIPPLRVRREVLQVVVAWVSPIGLWLVLCWRGGCGRHASSGGSSWRWCPPCPGWTTHRAGMGTGILGGGWVRHRCGMYIAEIHVSMYGDKWTYRGLYFGMKWAKGTCRRFVIYSRTKRTMYI